MKKEKEFAFFVWWIGIFKKPYIFKFKSAYGVHYSVKKTAICQRVSQRLFIFKDFITL